MTRKIYLIAGVAGLALTAPASAEKGGRDKSPQPAAQQGGGQQSQRPQRQEAPTQRVERQSQRVERPQRVEPPQRAERQQRVEPPQRAERQQMRRVEPPQRIERQQMQRAERPQRVERQQIQRAERPQRTERWQRMEHKAERVERPHRIDRQQQRNERKAARVEHPRRIERQAQRVERADAFRPQGINHQQHRSERHLTEQAFRPRGNHRALVRSPRFADGAYRPGTPVFATREMRPMVPFQTRVHDRQIFSIGDHVEATPYLTTVPALYATRYVDTNDYYHRYDNDLGYIYRIDRADGIVRSLYPLFGGYGIGDPWPQTYYSSYVPAGYRDFYYDTPDYYYRNDGYGIYQVDAGTQLITALVSLVFGQGYGVGQVLPASYGVYNVPLDYRGNYYDNGQQAYRYGDGFIYQMDPTSRLIAARYPIYADDYYVGNAWPVAYPDYNVPYGYRSTYYDTPQYQYRYANNGIYQVDPTNQVIMALVALVSGDRFAVGQRMPSGYDMYNVPFDYRDRYADSDNDYYRYANGYVYRVDPDSWVVEEAYPVYA